MRTPEAVHFYDTGRQQKWAIPILYQDESMLSIDKPSGLPVIPERWHPSGRLEDWQAGHHEVRVLERFHGYTAVETRPATGRQHQIRVHLQAIGHPLVVDSLHGRNEAFYLSSLKTRMRFTNDEEERTLISRLSLHASSLRFRHPAPGESTIITATLPKDLLALLKALREYA